MIERVRRTIERFRMFSPGERVGVAVSGGADSLGLLFVLRELSPIWDLRLSVVHIEHGLRGEASLEDARFVERTAEDLRLPFHLRRARAAEAGGNLEQTGRRIRHAFFRELLAEGSIDRVATGHTLTDQAETVLFRILRGAGLTGLRGVLPVTAEGLVRPLLEVRREEIVTFLGSQGMVWREDQTNRDARFARNRLRHEILPQLRAVFNAQVDDRLANLAELARDEEDWWAGQLLIVSTGLPGTARILRVNDLLSKHPAVARRFIRQEIRQVKGDLRQVGFGHVEAVLDLARSERGSGIARVPGLAIQRSFDQIRIARATGGVAGLASQPVKVPGLAILAGGEGALHIDLIDRRENAAVCDTFKDELDWQRLCFVFEPRAGASCSLLELRSWRPGDHYRPAGKSNGEKIKLLFQEARIPIWERGAWPVLTCAGKIAWVRRFGAAAEFAAGPDTPVVVRIREDRGPD